MGWEEDEESGWSWDCELHGGASELDGIEQKQQQQQLRQRVRAAAAAVVETTVVVMAAELW